MRSRVRKELDVCEAVRENKYRSDIRCARSKYIFQVAGLAPVGSVSWIRNTYSLISSRHSSSDMDENLSRGYVQLGKARGMNEFKFSNGFTHLSPPVDKYNFIYMALILGGIGFLLPYNRSLFLHLDTRNTL